MAERPAGGIVVSPVANRIFTTIFVCEVAAVFYCLSGGRGYVAHPLAPSAAVVLLAGAMVTCYGAIALVKRGSLVLCRPLSRRAFPGDPLRKLRTRRKFQDQMWQLAIHTSMAALEAYILFYEGRAFYDDGTRFTWADYTRLWVPHPYFGGQTSKLSVHVLYLVQMAIWVDTTVHHRFLDERHKDYFLMYTHHLVTIALVGSAYFYNNLRIGVLVMWVHDVSDIPVDLLKIFNYCQLEGPRGLFLTELTFAINLFSWLFYRFYRLGYHILARMVLLGSREMASQPSESCFDEWNRGHGGPSVGPYLRGHSRSWTPGDGTFDLVANLRKLPTHPCLALYWESGTLLLLLQVMQVVWYCMFLRILWRMLTAKSADLHDAGREVYEGDSDDELATPAASPVHQGSRPTKPNSRSALAEGKGAKGAKGGKGD